jgi:hypothetical protein
MLDQEKEVWWETSDLLFASYRASETAMLDVLLRPLRDMRRRIFGGIDRLGEFHLAIVKGGAWEGRREYSEPGAGAPRPPSALAVPRRKDKKRLRSSSGFTAHRKAHSKTP